MAKIPATQDFLEFDQIRDGVLILKSKGLRAVLMVSSINFGLKSQEEQSSILYNFQNFLNSLDFSCQILVQSRKLNMIGYLEKLKDIAKKERNDLLKNQVLEYRKFIDDLISRGNIMQKSFYVVVPFSVLETKGIPMSKLKKRFSRIVPNLTEEEFKRAKIQLLQRLEFIAMGLSNCGLHATPLGTLEIVELLWALHHPRESEKGYYPEFPTELSEMEGSLDE